MQHQRPPRSYQIRRDSLASPGVSPMENLVKQQPFAQTSQSAYMSPSFAEVKHAKLSQHSPASYYGNRFAPYGGLSSGKQQHCHSVKVQASNFVEQPCEQLNAAAAANLVMQNSFNPFNSEIFFNSIQNSYLSPNNAGLQQQQFYNRQKANFMANNFNLPMASKMASSIQNTLNQYPLACSLLNNSAFKNVAASFSSASANISSASSGYSTSDETSSVGENHKEVLQNSNLVNESIKTEYETKEDQKPINMVAENNSKLNSTASLAHIMNWIKTTPSTENFNEITSRILYAALKWTKTQKNFINLPVSDQILLITESLSELFVLQMAENKLSLNDGKSLIKFIFMKKKFYFKFRF